MSKKLATKQTEEQDAVLRENMKCPVCLEVLLPPIYQCETGHNICYSCVESVHLCPLCKGDYGDTRNYFAEDLVNSMTFPCKFEEYGCKLSCLGSQLKEHQETCEFQPYRCPELDCKEVLGLHQMAKHLEKHGFKVLKGDSHIATIDIQDEHFDKRTEYNPWRISAFDKEFYTIVVRSRDGNWYFWAWMLGLPREAKAYSYEMAVFTLEKQILFRGQVHSLRTSAEDLMKSANCLVCHDQLIKSMRKDNKINCSVRFIEGKIWDAKKTVKPKTSTTAPKAGVKDTKKSLKPKSKLVGPSPGPPPNTPSGSPYIAPKKLKSTTAAAKSKASKSNQVQIRHNSGVSYLRRKISEEEHEFVVKMRESLRCPGCEQVISPPILQCSIGHNICVHCRAVREDCPLCRAPFGISRNFFAEELLYRTVQRCQFYQTGCEVCLPTAQIRLHEVTCDFAPFECPFNSCRQNFDPKELLTHLKSHGIPVIEGELKSKIAVPKGANSSGDPICSIPSIVTLDGATFYPLIVRDTNNLWSFWVCSTEYGNYKYEIVLRRMSKVLAFSGPVLSLRMNQSLVLSNGLSLITSDRAVKGLKTDTHLEYSLKIAPIRPLVCQQFLTSLGIDLKKLKSSKILTKTELHANKKSSARSAQPNDDSDESDYENMEIAAEYFPSHSSIAQNGENAEANDAEQTKTSAAIVSSSSQTLTIDVKPAEDLHSSVTSTCNYPLPYENENTLTNAPETTPSASITTSTAATSSAIKPTLENFLKEIGKSLALTTPRARPEVYEMTNGRYPQRKSPEVISSSPILPSSFQIKHHQNVRLNSRRRNHCLRNLAYFSAKSDIWESKPFRSIMKITESKIATEVDPQAGLSSQREITEQIPSATGETEPAAEIQNESIDTTQDAALTDAAADLKLSDFDFSSTANIRLCKSSISSLKTEKDTARKSSIRKSEQCSSTKSKAPSNKKRNSPVPSRSRSPNRSSSTAVPIAQTVASLDVRVTQKASLVAVGTERPSSAKCRRNSKVLVSQSSDDEQQEPLKTVAKALPTRSNLHVKFADLPDMQIVKNDAVSEEESVHTISEGEEPQYKIVPAQGAAVPEVVPMPMISSRNISTISEQTQTETRIPDEDKQNDKPNTDVVDTVPERKPSIPTTVALDINENIICSPDIQVQIDAGHLDPNHIKYKELDMNQNFVTADMVDIIEDGFENVSDSEAPLIYFGDMNLDIPSSHFDTAIFEGDRFKSESSIPNASSRGSLHGDFPSQIKSQSFVSEFDLLKHNVPQKSHENILSGLDENGNHEETHAEVATETEGEELSEKVPENEADQPEILQEEMAEAAAVEETQTACQVGSSLLKLNAESAAGDNIDANETAEASILDLGQSYDTIADGITYTLNAVKSIFSGFVGATQMDGYDEEESGSGSDPENPSKINFTDPDFLGFDDNEPN